MDSSDTRVGAGSTSRNSGLTSAHGVRTKLLTAAEDLARARGCVGASLDTFEYQARPFYEKLGYELFGTLDGYPPGYRQFYLRKNL